MRFLLSVLFALFLMASSAYVMWCAILAQQTPWLSCMLVVVGFLLMVWAILHICVVMERVA